MQRVLQALVATLGQQRLLERRKPPLKLPGDSAGVAHGGIFPAPRVHKQVPAAARYRHGHHVPLGGSGRAAAVQQYAVVQAVDTAKNKKVFSHAKLSLRRSIFQLNRASMTSASLLMSCPGAPYTLMVMVCPCAGDTAAVSASTGAAAPAARLACIGAATAPAKDCTASSTCHRLPRMPSASPPIKSGIHCS